MHCGTAGFRATPWAAQNGRASPGLLSRSKWRLLEYEGSISRIDRYYRWHYPFGSIVMGGALDVLTLMGFTEVPIKVLTGVIH